MVMRRCTPDEGLDEGDEGLDVPGGMKNVKSLKVLPQSAERVMIWSSHVMFRTSTSQLLKAVMSPDQVSW